MIPTMTTRPTRPDAPAARPTFAQAAPLAASSIATDAPVLPSMPQADRFAPASPATPATPMTASSRPAALRFGSCVNASTKRAQFQEELLKVTGGMRIHYLLEAGKLARADFSEVLTDFLLREGAFTTGENNHEANGIAIVSLVETAEKNPETKAAILAALEKAKKKAHLRAQRALINEAIDKLNGHQTHPSEQWRHIQEHIRNEHGASHHHH